MRTTVLIGLLGLCAAAQEVNQHIVVRDTEAGGPVGVASVMGGTLKGAPYSGTIVTENIQVLADGNRIVNKQQGMAARDSQGRMRHEAVLPVIGTMSAAGHGKIVFINDPVAGVTYNLNLTEKTYRKMPVLTTAGVNLADKIRTAGSTFNVTVAPPPGATGPTPTVSHMRIATGITAVPVSDGDAKTESLGSKVIEGVRVDGTRSVRTIAAGEIGNDKPIEIISETWFSPELRTIVYSKRSDPRMGDYIYSLTNISRSEPDASLFAVPAGFKEATGNQERVILYKSKED